MKAKVTIYLEEYNKLLDESKKYHEGFLSTYTQDFKYGYRGDSKIITTNEHPVKYMFTLLNEKDIQLASISRDLKSLKTKVIWHNNMPFFRRFRRIKFN